MPAHPMMRRSQVPLLSDKQEKGRHQRRMRDTFMTIIEMDGNPPSWNLCARCSENNDDALGDLVQGVCEECRHELWYTQLEDYPEDYIKWGLPGHDESYDAFIDEMHELY